MSPNSLVKFVDKYFRHTYIRSSMNFRSFGYRPVSIIRTLCSIIVHLEFSLRYHFTTYRIHRSFDQEQERDAPAHTTARRADAYILAIALRQTGARTRKQILRLSKSDGSTKRIYFEAMNRVSSSTNRFLRNGQDLYFSDRVTLVSLIIQQRHMQRQCISQSINLLHFAVVCPGSRENFLPERTFITFYTVRPLRNRITLAITKYT